MKKKVPKSLADVFAEIPASDGASISMADVEFHMAVGSEMFCVEEAKFSRAELIENCAEKTVRCRLIPKLESEIDRLQGELRTIADAPAKRRAQLLEAYKTPRPDKRRATIDPLIRARANMEVVEAFKEKFEVKGLPDAIRQAVKYYACKSGKVVTDRQIEKTVKTWQNKASLAAKTLSSRAIRKKS